MQQVNEILEKLNNYIKGKNVQGQILYRSESSHLVRCAGSQISTNVSEKSASLAIEIQSGKRSVEGRYKGSLDDFSKITEIIDKLCIAVEITPEIPFLTPLDQISADENLNAVEETIAVNSENVVQLFADTKSRFSQAAVDISGACSLGHSEYAVINTMCERPLFQRCNDYNVEVVLQLSQADKKELRVAATGDNWANFDHAPLLSHLEKIHQLKTTTGIADLPSGPYDVVFAADAFAEFFLFLVYLGLGGESYEFQTGMFQKEKHKIGGQLFHSALTIIDDPQGQDVLYRRRFGMNGKRRDHFPLVENGVLKNLYYSDKKVCDRFSKKVNNDINVASLKVERGGGPSDFDAMVQAATKKTVYIPYVHYMNATNPSKGEVTGTSRFGTFLLENGQVTNHLYNLRINDSLHNLFNNIEWLSDELTDVNLSNTYGLRNPLSLTCPKFVKINGVYISGSNKQG